MSATTATPATAKKPSRPLDRAQAALLALAGQQDLMIAALLVMAVGLMVLPIPTWLLDLLLGFNLGCAVLLLMVAIYLRTPLDFSSLPAVILISTVFRLALAVTTTRLVLLQADAGRIVATFGHFVVGGNLGVGLVVFLIITVVQFLVVTKGAERVAEVGARFTLDALPGKQMSIDADLRSGDIDQVEARRRRRVLERESQLHGAMDGAMKFVKGDAVAGLIIIVINLIGGVSIGTLGHGLGLAEAVQTYSLLTVGDALVSQIPALFLAIGAAVVVTRVGTDEASHLGAEILGQVSRERRALRLAAGTLLVMSLVPGFPAPVFLVLAAAFAAASVATQSRAAPSRQAGGAAGEADRAVQADAPPPAAALPVRRALAAVRLSPDLAGALGGASRVRGPVEAARAEVADTLGVACPDVDVLTDERAEGLRYRIELDEVPVEAGELRPDLLLLRDDPVHLDLLGLEPVPGPAVAETQGCWVEAMHAERLAAAGIGFSDGADLIGIRLRAALRRHSHGFVGIQETRALLQRAEREYADLVREATRLVTVQKLAEILRRLVEEEVSIRNLRLILEAVAEWGEREARVMLLTEYVRAALARQICHQHANAQKVIAAWILDQETEAVVRAALRETQVGIYLALDAATSERLVEAVRTRLASAQAVPAPVVIASLDVRRHLRGLLRKNGVAVAVLSYQELAADFHVQPLGSVGAINPASPARVAAE